MPSEVSDVLRFNFCVWTQHVRAIDMGRWAACQPLPTDAELTGADASGVSTWARRMTSRRSGGCGS